MHISLDNRDSFSHKSIGEHISEEHLPVASAPFLCQLHYPAVVCNQPCKALMQYHSHPSIWSEEVHLLPLNAVRHIVMSAEFMEASCSRSCNDGSEAKPVTVVVLQSALQCYTINYFHKKHVDYLSLCYNLQTFCFGT